MHIDNIGIISCYLLTAVLINEAAALGGGVGAGRMVPVKKWMKATLIQGLGYIEKFQHLLTLEMKWWKWTTLVASDYEVYYVSAIQARRDIKVKGFEWFPHLSLFN